MEQLSILRKCLIGILAILGIAAYMALPDPALTGAEWSRQYWASKAGCAVCVLLLCAIHRYWRTDRKSTD